MASVNSIDEPKRYKFLVKTDRDLGGREFVSDLLTAWVNHPIAALRPDRFDLGEPIRKPFLHYGVQEAIDLWLKEMPLMLKRVAKPKFLVDINWRRIKGLDPQVAPWDCSVSLDFNAGDEIAYHLFEFLIDKFSPAFGYITTDLEERRKHFVKVPMEIGTSMAMAEEYAGRDIIDKLPGIYWKTFLGPIALDILRRKSFDDVSKEMVAQVNNGYVITAYEHCIESGSSAAIEAEHKLATILGAERFFDRDSYLLSAYGAE